MSKIAEKRADEIIGEYHDGDYTDHSRHNTQWVSFKQGYDQAMQDMARDADRLQYLSDELGYAYACGCKKTMQDFLERAEEFLYLQLNNGSIECGNIKRLIEQFKNYIQDE